MQIYFGKFFFGVLLVVLMAPQGQAASKHENECAIWLCLPAGFAHPQCDEPRKEFIRRIKNFKSPLPNIGGCLESGDGSNMAYDYNYAAYVPAGQRCAEWSYDGSDYSPGGCARYETWDGHYIKGTKCRTRKEDENTPAGCTGTARSVDIYVDGQLSGETYYWGKSGARRF